MALCRECNEVYIQGSFRHRCRERVTETVTYDAVPAILDYASSFSDSDSSYSGFSDFSGGGGDSGGGGSSDSW